MDQSSKCKCSCDKSEENCENNEDTKLPEECELAEDKQDTTADSSDGSTQDTHSHLSECLSHLVMSTSLS